MAKLGGGALLGQPGPVSPTERSGADSCPRQGSDKLGPPGSERMNPRDCRATQVPPMQSRAWGGPSAGAAPGPGWRREGAGLRGCSGGRSPPRCGGAGARGGASCVAGSRQVSGSRSGAASMARGTRWLLLGCGLCLALAVRDLTATTAASQSITSTQHPRTATTPPQSPQAASSQHPATATTSPQSPQAASSQHPATATTPPQSSLAASGDTSLSAAPADNTTASTQYRTTAAAPALSRNPESASSPPLFPASPSYTNTSSTPAASSSETYATEQPEPNSGSTASGSEVPVPEQPALSQRPGLVAAICLFTATLLIAAGGVMVKLCHRREPAFRKLDEVSMGTMTEDSPFARYPPK
ncbi:nuclear pore complex protein NUP62-like [Dermochelys coriacea]|uniref:nuclear pore complex protein NUP62-like n=1 Tax=Dermochelys coriacea TaxID=27794 RepID=UPI001CA801BC|nr:nuclear pore complex protein NUP62-like [Dermochelys coriacea]